MNAMEKLNSHLDSRLIDLHIVKEQGVKIFGYVPGGYFPEELVLASGAINV